MKGRVGVAGLGIMGGAISRNLAAAGWEVHGFDPDPEQAARAAARGVAIAADSASLAAEVPVVLASLPSASAAIATAEAVAGAAVLRTLVELSTLAVADKMRVKEIVERAGGRAIDCPISGTGAQAENRDLVLYASGDSGVIAEVRPLLEDFSRAAHDVGAYGNGSRMKFVANLLVAIHNVASAEAMVLAMKAGLDLKQVVALVAAGAGTSRVFELRAPMMAEARYTPATMKNAIWQKDMAVIAAFAAEIGCPVPLFSASAPYYAATMAMGHAEDDTAAVCAVLEVMAGSPRRAGSNKS
ncbi:MAG: NAD(P)-dependent oxidoreductase [Rhodospirillales bacterium]|nr:NAD(P)-dependent oxidoreductase [Rhodospirillales bacterium]